MPLSTAAWARLRSLNALIDEQTVTAVWMQPQQGNVDIQHIDEDRWAYVNAATTTLTTPVYDPERSLRLFDLQPAPRGVRLQANLDCFQADPD